MVKSGRKKGAIRLYVRPMSHIRCHALQDNRFKRSTLQGEEPIPPSLSFSSINDFLKGSETSSGVSGSIYEVCYKALRLFTVLPGSLGGPGEASGGHENMFDGPNARRENRNPCCWEGDPGWSSHSSRVAVTAIHGECLMIFACLSTVRES